MGTSFTTFNGYGFWASDHCSAIWMASLTQQMDHGPAMTHVQTKFRDDLIFQASLQIVGAVDCCLSHVERSNELQPWAISMGEKAISAYSAFGDYLPRPWFDALFAAPGAVDTGPHYGPGKIPTAPHIEHGKTWLRLLKGDFVPLPASPSGLFHATGEIEKDLTYCSQST